MEVLLSSERFIKEVTSISDNLFGKYIMPALREAQDIGLRGILGDCLLERLCQLVASGDLSAEGNEMYQALVDRCQYYLAYMTVVEVLGKCSYKVGNFGVSRSTDEHLESAGHEDIARQAYYYQSKADASCYRLQQWLLDNRTSFPELNDCDCSRMRSNLRSAATCGIWLGGARAYKMGGPCE